MTRKKSAIQTHFSKLIVQLIPRQEESYAPARGYGLHRRDNISALKRYEVLATYLHRYGDGSTVTAFLITEVGGGPVLERACTLFKVIEVEVEVET